MCYVIIGNSAACIGAIEAIRQIDKDNKIIVITSENHHTYSRPLISYLLCGKTTEEKMKYRSNTFYEDNGVELIFDTVIKIDSTDKSVTLESGKKIFYNKLLVSTGSKPFVPSIKGLDSVKNSFTLMHLDDAIRLQKAVDKNSRVLI